MSSALDEIATCYRADGLAAALDAVASLRSRRRTFRLAAGAVEAIFPVQRVAVELLEYSELVGLHGLGKGSRQALVGWGVSPRVEASGSAWRVLADEPFLAFGNHPTGVEGALFSALLRREDVFFLAGSHVAQLAPSLASKVLPIERTRQEQRSSDALPRSRSPVHALSQKLWAPGGLTAAKQNREALDRAAQLVAEESAGVHVFPSGSTRTDGWRRGIGRIVCEITKMGDSATGRVFLVPVVYGVRPAHLMASKLFPAWSAAHVLSQALVWSSLGPPWIFIGHPRALSSLGLTRSTSPREATSAMSQLWSSAAAEAHASMPRWSPFERAHFARLRHL